MLMTQISVCSSPSYRVALADLEYSALVMEALSWLFLFGPFWSLTAAVCCTVCEDSLCLCVLRWQNGSGVGTVWKRVNNGKNFNLGWSISLILLSFLRHWLRDNILPAFLFLLINSITSHFGSGMCFSGCRPRWQAGLAANIPLWSDFQILG